MTAPGTAALQVDGDDPTPPYEQLRRQLVQLIGSGALLPGDRLPPLRQLAADLGLAVGTVARTYRELERAGLAVSRRGGGTRVGAAATRRSDEHAGRALRTHAEAFVRQARLLGAGDAAVSSAVARALGEGRPEGNEFCLPGDRRDPGAAP